MFNRTTSFLFGLLAPTKLTVFSVFGLLSFVPFDENCNLSPFLFLHFLSFSSFFSPLLFYDRFSTEAHTRNFRPAFTSNGYENVVYRKAPKQGLFFGKFFSLHDVMKKSIDIFCRIFYKMLFLMFI